MTKSSQVIFQRVLPPPAIRLSDVVCKKLEELIASGQLTPGEGLPSERELARSLGVSRPSLREALSTLRSRGLIERARKGSVVVAEREAPAMARPLLEAISEPPGPTRDLMELRFGIEAYAAFLAAGRATAADLERIKAALQASSKGRSKNAALLAKLDVAFHRSITDAAHNVALQHTFQALSKITLPYVQRGYELILASDRVQEDRAHLLETHTAIFSAIRDGDADAAWLAAYSHLEFSEHVWTSDTF